METLKNQILNAINNAKEAELIELNNRYAQECNMHDSEVFNNDEEFFEMFYSNSGDGLKVAQAVFYGDYNYSHRYVCFNGYGNLKSYDYFEVKDLCELPEVISEYVSENFTDFNDLDVFTDIEE